MNTSELKVARIFSMLVLSSLLFACETGTQEVDLKENEARRAAVYDQILNDEELFNEFMDRMSQNDRSMDWMASHQNMMQEMYSREHIETMMRNNPQMMDNVMEGMISAMQRDTTLMRQNPQMRQEMMQNMMNMIQQDTVMYRQMEQRMQQHHMGSGNRMN